AGGGEAKALVVDLPEKDRENGEAVLQGLLLQKLAEDRKALVEKRTKKAGLRSVTSLVHSGDDKFFREDFALEGQGSASEGISGGKAFGVLTHKLLEKGWDWEKETIQK